MFDLTKKIVVPLDGSRNALKSFDYLDLVYGPKHNLEINLFHVLPSLPPILTDEKILDKDILLKKSDVEKKNLQMAERLLAEAKDILMEKGFDEERITTLFQKKTVSTARDICNWASREQADAVALTRRGETDLDTFFMGGISSKLVHYCANCPVWILGGGVHAKKMLVCMDGSENSFRAADHTGFMLSRTDCQVTLFHSTRDLTRYVPVEALENAEELQLLWKNKAGQQIASYMEKARETLLTAGLASEQIAMKIADGSRSAADDILKEARNNGYGTIVLGRHGESMAKEFLFGSVTNKLLHHSLGFAVWIVQ